MTDRFELLICAGMIIRPKSLELVIYGFPDFSLFDFAGSEIDRASSGSVQED